MRQLAARRIEVGKKGDSYKGCNPHRDPDVHPQDHQYEHGNDADQTNFPFSHLFSFHLVVCNAFLFLNIFVFERFQR